MTVSERLITIAVNERPPVRVSNSEHVIAVKTGVIN